jgi:hypothetical protein
LIRTLEPGDHFLDVVYVHQVGAMHAPEDLGIEVGLQFFYGAEVRLTLQFAGDDADDAVLNASIDDFIRS